MIDGTVKGCGWNYYGQLGLGNTTTTQKLIVDIPISNVKEISCGSHTIFLLNDGTVKGCGYNEYGQLGIDNTTDQISIIDIPINDVSKLWDYHEIIIEYIELINSTVKLTDNLQNINIKYDMVINKLPNSKLVQKIYINESESEITFIRDKTF